MNAYFIIKTSIGDLDMCVLSAYVKYICVCGDICVLIRSLLNKATCQSGKI